MTPAPDDVFCARVETKLAEVGAQLDDLRAQVRQHRRAASPERPPPGGYCTKGEYWLLYGPNARRYRFSKKQIKFLREMGIHEERPLEDLLTELAIDEQGYYQLQGRLNRRLRALKIPFHFRVKDGVVGRHRGLYRPKPRPCKRQRR
jgi:hypothetical protein